MAASRNTTRRGTRRRAARGAPKRETRGQERLLRELRRTLRERDESTSLLDALFVTAPVGLALLDREMRYLRVNPALAAMNGVPAERHLGKTPWEILPGLPCEEMLRDFRLVLESGVPISEREICGETPAAPGRERVFIQTFYPLRVAGRAVGVGVLIREATAEREAREFQRQLLPIVAHDLRSPLLAIGASASILSELPLQERDAKVVARIQSSAARMGGIIRALGDYARAQSGQGIPLERRSADLGEISRQVVEEALGAWPGCDARCDFEGDLRGRWDVDRLGQAISNLVSNALAHSPEGAPVEVGCRGVPGDVALEVRNRAFIPPDLQAHLFEPFRRGPPAKGASHQGLGLGLFIARQIVLAHGGTIAVASDPVGGTVVAVRLPRGP